MWRTTRESNDTYIFPCESKWYRVEIKKIAVFQFSTE